MKNLEENPRVLRLYRRAAMGYIPEKKESLNRAIDQLFKASEAFSPIDIVGNSNTETPKSMAGDSVTMIVDREMAKKEMQRMEREHIRDLNTTWLGLMTRSESVLRERMSLFWHGHFACRSQNPVFVQRYINTIRKNALGSFGEMLMAVSKEPAMLQFLNNQQNKKNSPNENFAREVMELFTLGRGNYTEVDVKESARAFTGWGFNNTGEFQFRERQHDQGEKTFLGKTGAFDGTDIIRMLLERRETASFVTRKIYYAFVSEVPDEERLAKLSDGFFRSNYDIGKLMMRIFKSDWFYDTAPQNSLIKSPVELMVGIQRTLKAPFAHDQSALFVQRVLGQTLFYPPNVAGWPGGRNWIDSSSLMLRMQLPKLMMGNSESAIKSKESGDDNDLKVKKRANNLQIEVDWNNWAQRFDGVPLESITEVIASQLLGQTPKGEVMSLVNKDVAKETDRLQRIKNVTQAVMCLPEYQLI